MNCLHACSHVGTKQCKKSVQQKWSAIFSCGADRGRGLLGTGVDWNVKRAVGQILMFTVCRLRHIWVQERMSLDAVHGPQNEHSCMTMGNSVEQWKKSYDLAYMQRDAQEGVDKTALWRENMIAKALETCTVVEGVDAATGMEVD